VIRTWRALGATVDRDRGNRQDLPRPAAPEPYPVYQVAWVGLLPRPEGMNRGCITRTAPAWQRLGRQLVPRRGVRDCCYYHSIDWHRVSAAAIRITRQARREGQEGEAFASRLIELARTETLRPEEEEALTELIGDGSGIWMDRDGTGRRYYINGRHRVTAMLDAGVWRTVVIGTRWEMPDWETAK
jgi:hypothetical protein